MAGDRRSRPVHGTLFPKRRVPGYGQIIIRVGHLAGIFASFGKIELRTGLYPLKSSRIKEQIAVRDERITALDEQVAEAAKNAEIAEQLRGEIASLKQQSSDVRVGFSLQLAGCRNVKAARAVLSDYESDIDKLKAGGPWLFFDHDATQGRRRAAGASV